MGAQDLHFERLDRAVHEARFLEFAEEFRDLGEGGFERLDLLFSDPDRYFDLVHRFEHDRDLPDKWVPMSHLLFFESDRLVGGSRLRRRLSPVLHLDGGHIGYEVRPSARRRGYATEILRQTLGKARREGIPKALLTVATTNHPCLRVIEKNGGVFERETLSPRTGETMRRYWIDTAREVSP